MFLVLPKFEINICACLCVSECVRQTCICTDWQLTNSTDETRLSKTTDDLRHESRNTEFSFPFTVSVESWQLNMYTTLFISTLSSITKEWLPRWCSCNMHVFTTINLSWNRRVSKVASYQLGYPGSISRRGGFLSPPCPDKVWCLPNWHWRLLRYG